MMRTLYRTASIVTLCTLMSLPTYAEDGKIFDIRVYDEILEEAASPKQYLQSEIERNRHYPFMDRVVKFEREKNFSGAYKTVKKYLSYKDDDPLFLWRAVRLSFALKKYSDTRLYANMLSKIMPNFKPAKAYQYAADFAVDEKARNTAFFTPDATTLPLKKHLVFALKDSGYGEKSADLFAALGDKTATDPQEKADIFFTAANAYAQNRNNLKSLEYFKKSQELDPTTEKLQSILELTYKTGDLESSFTYLQSAYGSSALPAQEAAKLTEQVCGWATESKEYALAIRCTKSEIKRFGATKKRLLRLLEIAKNADDAPLQEQTLSRLNKLAASPVTLAEEAQFYYQRADYKKSGQLFEKAFTASDHETVSYALSALNSYRQGKLWTELDRYGASLKDKGLPTKVEHMAFLNHAFAAVRLGNKASVHPIISSLLKDQALNADNRRMLAYLLLEMGENEKAAETFWDLYKQNPSAENAFFLANSQMKGNRPGIAAYFFEEALSVKDKDQHLTAHETLGYLYYDNFEPKTALRHWKAALEIKETPRLRLHLAQAYLADKKPLETLEQLAKIPAKNDLGKNERIILKKAKARALLMTDQTEKAQAALAEVIALSPDSATFLEAALLEENLGNLESAQNYIEMALKKDPKNDVIRGAYGYLLQKAGKKEKAIDTFNTYLETYPDHLKIWEDTGYLYAAKGDTDEAQEAFSKVIEEPKLIQAMSDLTNEETDKHIFDLRRQNTILDDDISGVAYTNICPSNDCKRRLPGTDINEAQGGIDVKWRLPEIGYIDGRIATVTTRLFWNNSDSRMDAWPDNDSLQAGIGLNYKPFKSHDFSVAAERLIAIGSDPEDNTLIRAMYGAATSLDVPPHRPTLKPYASFYAEAGKYLENTAEAYLLGEARLGAQTPVTDNGVFYPFLFQTGFTATGDDDYNDRTAKTGVGLGFRYWFDESKYHAQKKYVEVEAKFSRDVMDSRSDKSNRFILGIKVGF